MMMPEKPSDETRRSKEPTDSLNFESEDETQAEAEADSGQAQAKAVRSRAPERRKAPASAEEFVLTELSERVRVANSRLRAQLTGTILLELTRSGKKFLFDWNTDAFSLVPTEGAPADCIIRLREETLQRISLGELNPQIAMLSDKIEVSGRLSLAIYFFNLVVPPAGMERSRSGLEGYPSAGG